MSTDARSLPPPRGLASGNKKVLVARFEKTPIEGILQLPGGLTTTSVELLTQEGAQVSVAYSDVKGVCFVRDFTSDGGAGEVWLKHKAFLNRPKTNGLWIRVWFRDGDSLEGLMPNDMLMMETAGFSMTPPDPSSQTQRVWLPREALVGVEVLGVIGSPLKKRPKPETGGRRDQIGLFE